MKNTYKTPANNCCALLLFIILVFVPHILQAQTAGLDPGTNPSPIVPMGDTIQFTVNITVTANISNAELAIKVPAGFQIVKTTPVLKSGSLNATKDSARIKLPLITTSAPLTCTIYLKPICGVSNSSMGVITYNLYKDGTAATPLAATKKTQPVANIIAPIVILTPPSVANVDLNALNTRTLSIEQTSAGSYVNNMLIEAICDTSKFNIYKLEISADGLNYIDVTSTVLDRSKRDRYQYLIKSANAFTALGYNGRLDFGKKIYIRETYSLEQCGKGDVTYKVSYGDGVTFCPPVASVDTRTDARLPGYQHDITLVSSGTYPTKPSVNGWYVFRMANNSTDPAAAFYNVLARASCTDLKMYVFKRAYFVNASGIPIKNGADTIFIPVENKLNLANNARYYFVALDKLNNPALATFYQAAGLSSLDGDGIYDDMLPGSKVDIRVEYNIDFTLNFGASYPVSCSLSALQNDASLQTYLYYQTVCHNTYNTYMRPYGSASSTYYFIGNWRFSQPSVTPSVSTVNVDDVLYLQFQDRRPLPSNGTSGSLPSSTTSGNSSYYITVKLPDGLDYAGDVKVNNVSVPASNIQLVNAQKIVVKLTSVVDPNISIKVKANSANDESKEMTIAHSFDYGNTGTLLTLACYTAPVPYTKLMPCSYLQLKEFAPERTSFGWTDITKSQKANRNTPGVNVRAAGNFDNVSMTARVKVNADIAFNENDSILAEMSYYGATGSQANAYFVKESGRIDGAGALIRYFKASDNTTPFKEIIVAPDDVLATYSYDNTNSVATHSLKTDILPYLQKNGIPALNTGDSCEIIIYTRANNLPNTAITVQNFQMQVYGLNTGVKTSCYSLFEPKFYLWNTLFTAFGVGSANNQGIYQENQTKTLQTLVMAVTWATGCSSNIFPYEYRPNADTITPITITMNSLLKITKLNTSYPGTVIQSNEVPRTLVEGTDYSVSYSNGQTILNIAAPKDLMSVYSWGGLMYNMTFDMVNRNALNKYITVSRTNVPTSEAPYIQAWNNYDIGYSFGQTQFYQYTLISTSPSQNPLGNIVEWPIALTNTSLFANTDGVLPHSWMAFECDPGVKPYQLIDADNGNTIVASGEQFIPYGTSGTKWWVKLDNLNCPTVKNFKLQCTYTSCTGTPKVQVIYGMSRIDYPQDPENGYAQSPYNSPGFLKQTVSTSLKFTPPSSDFTGTLIHTTDPNGKIIFCSPVEFNATFNNALLTEVSNMKLQINLPAGFVPDNDFTPMVKIGQGAETAVEKPVQNGNTVIFTLGSAVLAPYGSANDAATLRFQMRTTCGFTAGSQIYADFMGESGCGNIKSKSYNSGRILLNNLNNAPDYLQTNSYISTMPLVSDNSYITLNSTFTYVGGTISPTNYAIIDLPADVDIISSTGLAFTKEGAQLRAPLQTNTSVNMTVVVKPKHPELWNCGDVKSFRIYSGITQEMECSSAPEGTCNVINLCDNERKLDYTTNKLTVAFDPVVSAYGNYNSTTTEKLTIKGKLINSTSFPVSVRVEVFTNKGGKYVLATGSNLTADVTIPARSSQSFSFNPILDVSNNICDLLMVVRNTNLAGVSNPYLCDSIAIALPVSYKLTQPAISVCSGNNLLIGDPAITGYSYTWDSNSYLNSNSIAQPVFNYNIHKDTSIGYEVTVTRADGCQHKDSVHVAVKASPSFSFVNLCSASSVNLTSLMPDAGNLSGLTMSYFNDAACSNSVPLPNNAAVAATYYIAGTNAAGCKNVAPITINALPVIPAIIGATNICEGTTAQLNNTGTGYSVSWKTTDMTKATVSPSGLVTAVAPGVADIRYIVTSANGCIDSVSKSITINALPLFSLNTIPAHCMNNDGQISFEVSNSAEPLLYSIDGVNYKNTNVFKGISTGNYTAVVKDNNGCVYSQNSTVQLDNDLTLNMGNNVTICEGTNATLRPSSNGAYIKWAPSEGLSNSSIINPVASPAATTTYYLQTGLGICTKTGSVAVIVNPAPVAVADRDASVCFKQNVKLNASGGITSVWKPSTFLNNSKSNNPTVVQPTATTTYSLTVKDENGCFSLNNASVTITVAPEIKIFAGNDTLIAVSQPLQLNAVGIGNEVFTRFDWYPAVGLNDAAVKNPIAILNSSVTYTVTATNQDGCTASDEINIKVYKGPEIYVPNAFTPNNDRINDVLKPIPVGLKEFRFFTVYNRWGQQIFHSTNPNIGWDGRFKNELLDNGVFVWIAEGVDFKGNVIQEKGTVMLIR